MSNALYRDCARLFMVGFPGPRIDDDFASLMDDGIFGAILFKRNVGTAQETAALCREHQVARAPALHPLGGPGGWTGGPTARRALHHPAPHA